GEKDQFRVWDGGTGKEIRRFDGKRKPLYFPRFSSDGQTIIAEHYTEALAPRKDGLGETSVFTIIANAWRIRHFRK
ncbi:MAG: hypothetical protein ACRDQZ_08720, partial [Mycobacteriales bacterium]